jgi:hypothetical protein
MTKNEEKIAIEQIKRYYASKEYHEQVIKNLKHGEHFLEELKKNIGLSEDELNKKYMKL